MEHEQKINHFGNRHDELWNDLKLSSAFLSFMQHTSAGRLKSAAFKPSRIATVLMTSFGQTADIPWTTANPESLSSLIEAR